MRFIPLRYPQVFSNALTRIKNSGKSLFISFDDGPNISVTPQVLDILSEYNAKASFFCIGKNCIENPEILERIIYEGHTIGNHSYSHLNAFKCRSKEWINDVLKESPVSKSEYFRPPYGNIFPHQYNILKRKYKIVLWDLISMDFHKNYSINEINDILLKKTRDGSIIIFHDTPKAAQKMIPALTFFLKHFSDKEYKFEKL